MEYVRRIQLVANEKGDVAAILIEWGEVGISDHCVQTLLRIQDLTSTTQQAAEGKIVFHSKCTGGGKLTNQEIFEKMRYGRLILNTGIYPCLKRARATSGAIRKRRIGLFQISGAERKKHTKAYGGETTTGEEDLIYGSIEHMLDEAAKMSGLTKKQYIDWKRIECMETNTKGNRGRSLSRRKKERRGLTEREDMESIANRRDRHGGSR